MLFIVVTMFSCFEYNETKYFHSENKRTKVKTIFETLPTNDEEITTLKRERKREKTRFCVT